MRDVLAAQWKPKAWQLWLFGLVVSAAAVAICSTSSFLYPFNDWSDANIYFTMGKGMANGRVLYRDLYDHKGPLLYALHALCYWISPHSFLGVYFLEVLAMAAFLAAVERMLTLYNARRAAWITLPAVALALLCSYSFMQGDSAEEWCLPLLAWSLYGLLRYLKAEAPKRMSARTLMLHGILCGCVLWIKFTLLGLHLAWIIVVFGQQLARRKYADAFKCLGWYALGVTVATLPWLVYFGVNGAIGDWLKVYLYDNLFLYSSAEGAGMMARVKAMVKAGVEWFAQNLGYSVPLIVGLGWGILRRKTVSWEKSALWLCAGLTALGVFVGGKTYPYYGYLLAALTAFAAVPISIWVCKWIPLPRKRWTQFACGVLACGICALGCLQFGWYVKPYMGKPKQEMMQYQIASVVEQTPNATLLNYGFMDAGFYTATGIVPNVKYFHQTNVPLAEMKEEQARYINEALCDYVVTRGTQPDSLFDNYELVATAKTPNFWYEQVYLYKRMDLGE